MFAIFTHKPRQGNPEVSDLISLMSCIEGNAELTALSKAIKFAKTSWLRKLYIFQNIAIFCMFSKLMRKDFAAKPYFYRQRNGFVAKRPVTHAVVTTVA